jgi:DNA-binding CsgD family transcriptional regulator
VGTLAAGRPPVPQQVPLTSREREVVALIDQGFSNKQIASQLTIEVATVKNHIHNALEKPGAKRRSEPLRCSAAPPGRAAHRHWSNRIQTWLNPIYSPIQPLA